MGVRIDLPRHLPETGERRDDGKVDAAVRDEILAAREGALLPSLLEDLSRLGFVKRDDEGAILSCVRPAGDGKPEIELRITRRTPARTAEETYVLYVREMNENNGRGKKRKPGRGELEKISLSEFKVEKIINAVQGFLGDRGEVNLPEAA